MIHYYDNGHNLRNHGCVCGCGVFISLIESWKKEVFRVSFTWFENDCAL